MQKLFIAVGTSLFAASVAMAEIESHSVPYSYSLTSDGDVYPRLTIPGFDDMSGSRTLTRVEVRVQSEIGAAIGIENMNSTPLADWSIEGNHLVLTSFEREDTQEFGPFAFLGGLFIEPFTSTLAPKDGVPDSGSDYFEFSDLTPIDSMLDMDPFFNDFFSGGGEIVAMVGPFTEFFLSGATQYDEMLGTGDAIVGWTDLTQSGTFTVSYEYSMIPEPASLLAIGGIIVLVCRRRTMDSFQNGATRSRR